MAIRVLLALLVCLLASAPVSAENRAIYFSYQPGSLAGSKHLYLPKLLVVSGSKKAQARAVFNRLRSEKSAAYQGVSLTISGTSATLKLRQSKQPELVSGEVYLSLAGLGISLTVDGKAIMFSGLNAPVLAPTLTLWQALAVSTLPLGSVRLPGGGVSDLASVRKRLKSKDRQLVGALYTTLKTGGATAQLAVIAYLKRAKLTGQATHLAALLEQKNTVSAVKLAVLGALKGERSKKLVARVEGLVKSDPDPRVKAAAVKMLIAAGVKKYAFILDFEKLKSGRESEVLKAIARLRKANNEAVVAALLDLLKHKSGKVRRTALKAVIGYKSFAPLVKVLGDAKVPLSLRLEIAAELKKQSSGALQGAGLGFSVRHSKSKLAIRDCQAIGIKKLKSATEMLASALVRPIPELRIQVIKTLGQLGDLRAFKPLHLLVKIDTKNREAITTAAVQILGKQPVDTVLARVKHKSPWVRRWAIMALGEASAKQSTPDPKVMKVLLAALKDSNAVIRQAAIFSLARLKKETVTAKLLSYASHKDAKMRAQVAVAATHSTSRKSAATLVKLLEDEEDDVKLLALQGVLKRKLHQALSTLNRMVKLTNVDVRRAVFQAVVVLAKPTDHQGLLTVYGDALYDADVQVKLAAITGLSVIGGKVIRRVVAALDGALSDSSAKVKIAALKALGKTADADAWKSVVKALGDSDAGVKRAALDALAKLPAKAARGALTKYIAGESSAALKSRAKQVLATLK